LKLPPPPCAVLLVIKDKNREASRNAKEKKIEKPKKKQRNRKPKTAKKQTHKKRKSNKVEKQERKNQRSRKATQQKSIQAKKSKSNNVDLNLNQKKEMAPEALIKHAKPQFHYQRVKLHDSLWEYHSHDVKDLLVGER